MVKALSAHEYQGSHVRLGHSTHWKTRELEADSVRYLWVYTCGTAAPASLYERGGW